MPISQQAVLELIADLKKFKGGLDEGEREVKDSVSQMQREADSLNFDKAEESAKGAGDEIKKAFGGEGDDGGILGEFGKGLGKVERGLVVATAAVGAFKVAFDTTRSVIDTLEEMSDGLIDVDGWAQTALGSLIQLFLPEHRDAAEAQANAIRLLNQQGIEFIPTAEGILAAQQKLEERFKTGVAQTDRYRDILKQLNEEQAGTTTEKLVQEIDDLVFAFEKATENGDDLINGPLGPEFRKRVLEASDAIQKMEASLDETASPEDLAKLEELKKKFIDLQNAARLAAAGQQEAAKATKEVAETSEEATKSLGDLFEIQQQGANAIEEAYRSARQEIAQTIAEIQKGAENSPEARDAERNLEGLEGERDQLQQLQDTQALTLEQSNRLLEIDGLISGAKKELTQTIREQTEAQTTAAEKQDLYNTAQRATNRLVQEARTQIASLRDQYGGLGDEALEEAEAIVQAFEGQDDVYKSTEASLANLNAQLQNQFDKARRSAEQQQRAADAAKDLGDSQEGAAAKSREAGKVFDEEGNVIADFGKKTQEAGDSAGDLADEVDRAAQNTKKLGEGTEIERYVAGWGEANDEVLLHTELLEQVRVKWGEINALMGA